MRLLVLLLFLLSESVRCSGLSISGTGFGEVSYGFGYHDRIGKLKRNDADLLENLRAVMAENLKKDLDVVKIYGYVRIENDVFAVYISSLRGGNRETVGLGELFFIDLGNREIRRVDKRKKGFESLLLSLGGRYSTGSVAVYGCLQGYPVAKADIDGDGLGDLMFSGGKGELYLPNDEVRASTRVDLYMSSSGHLSLPMHAESFLLYSDGVESGYKVSRSNSSDFVDGSLPEAGRGFRRFYKLFWGDWGENGERAIVLWERTYVSRKNNDVKIGVKLYKVNFRVFIVGNDFSVEEGGVEEAKKILENNGMNWNDGYPNRSLCNMSSDVDPILDYGRKELSIHN